MGTLTQSLLSTGAALDASATGTGKTVTAAWVARDLGLVPVVVCPAATVPQWVRALEAVGHRLMFVTSYGTLVRGGKGVPVIERVKRGRHVSFVWRIDPTRSLLIFDEVHKCKGPRSLSSKVLMAARDRGIMTLMLSATAARSPIDMKALGYALGLHNGRGWWNWCLKNGCTRPRFGGLHFSATAAHEVLPRIHDQIFGSGQKGVRMTLADAAVDMPANVIVSEAIDLDLDNYDPYMDPEFHPDAEPITRLLRARMWTEQRKVPYLVDQTVELVEEGRKVVIFYNFQETRARLIGSLGLTHGLQVVTVDGGQRPADREKAIRRFGSDAKPLGLVGGGGGVHTGSEPMAQVCLVQIQAGGAGLDGLQDTTGVHPRVSLICPTYSAVDMVQCLGRIYRSNTVTPCLQRIVWAAGTVEESCARSCRAKLADIDRFHDDDFGFSYVWPEVKREEA